MRKNITSRVLLGASFLALSGLAQAELTANVGVTSNYVFRGETQTDDGIAVQGGLDFTHSSGLYAGIWGSNVENPSNNDKGFEFDLYAGYNFKVNDKVAFDIGFITYQYTSVPTCTVNTIFCESDEVFVGASFHGFSATYYNGNPDAGNDYAYIDLKYTLALPQDFNVHVHYGYKDVDGGNQDAQDASVGLSKEISGLDLSLTWTTIDYDDNRSDENELFVMVTKSFDLMQ
jgi:uncharacterized protein (TIGR02001 family)